MITFSPIWITPDGKVLDNSPLAEGSTVSFTLSAEEIGSGTLVASPTASVRLPSAGGEIEYVKANGATLDDSLYEITGKLLQIDLSAFSGTVTLSIKRLQALTFSLLHGELPPGLSLSPSGVISGKIGNVPGSILRRYDFTVRLQNGKDIRDQNFAIRATPTPTATTWVTANLPYPDTDDALQADFYPFGTVKRLETKLIPLEGRDPDGETYQIELRPTGHEGGFFEGLPPGLVLRDGIIRGTIASKALPGRYLFRVGFVGQQINSILGEMFVQDATAITTYVPSLIDWVTPADLGSLPETFPCDLKIVARSGAQKVTYALSPGSGPLPPGIALNAITGDLQGFAGHVGGEMAYTFSVRARAGEIFSDRAFTLSIKDRYDTAQVIDIRLKLRTLDRLGIYERYRTLITTDKVYRPTDRNFGIQTEPHVYLIKGLRGPELDAALNEHGSSIGFGGPDYHGQFNVLLGRHYGAVARNDSGQIIYEVIYRTVIDPQALAGGFKFGTDEAIEDRILYPHSHGERQYIYPKSIRNARMDLTRDLGFATTVPALKYLTDTEGLEALPKWMTSRQTIDDPSSVLGYFPALVIGYVLPGEAAPILNVLNQDNELPRVGTTVVFDRYHTYDHVVRGGTTWDDGTTTFDNNETAFDVV